MRGTRALFFALILIPQPVLAAPGRTALEDLLSDYERVPNKAALDRLGPDVPQLLRQIVAEPGRRQVARTRAIAVLRYYPSAETVALLERVMEQAPKAEKRGLALLDLRQALGSYAGIKGAAALERLAPYLDHPVVDVRLAAARALVLTRSPRVAPLLRQRLQRETTPMLRQQLQAQLAQLHRTDRPATAP